MSAAPEEIDVLDSIPSPNNPADEPFIEYMEELFVPNASLYQFALVGLSAAGKTCILGAMHLSGNTGIEETVTVEPPVDLRPEGNLAELTSQERRLISRHDGYDLWNRAGEALERGETPAPTPPTELPPTLDLVFGSPSRGTFNARVPDYAGGVLERLGQPGSDGEIFAPGLRRLLERMDGMLVLIETPFRGESNAEVGRRLRPLSVAFATLADATFRERTPIAVALTKWDRRSPAGAHREPSIEAERVRELLGEYPAIQGIVNNVRNIVAGQARIGPLDSLAASGATALENNLQEDEPTTTAGRLTFDNCAVFPTTAFGRSGVVSDHLAGDVPLAGRRELPADGVHPYGVVAPWIWLAHRRDELDAAKLNEDWQRKRAGAILPWRFSSGWGVARGADNALRRLPARAPTGSPSATVRRIRREALFRAWTGSVAATSGLLLFAVATLVVGWGLWDRAEFVSHRAVVDSDRTTLESLESEQNWFEDYLRRSHVPLVAPTADGARKAIDAIADSKDDLLWQPVKAAKSSETRLNAAEEYLAKLPGGRHAPQARTIVQTSKAEIARQENAELIDRLENDFAALERQPTSTPVEIRKSIEEAGKLRQQLAAPPHPNFLDEELRTRRHELDRAIAKFSAKLAGRLSYDEWEDGYDQAIAEENFPSAGRLLVAWSDKTHAGWIDHARAYPGRLFQHWAAKRSETAKTHDFQETSEGMSASLQTIRGIEGELRGTDAPPELVSDFTQAMQSLNGLQQKLNGEHDLWLYQRVLEMKDEHACAIYLAEAPLKTMEKEVADYRTHLQAMKSAIDLEVEFYVAWDEDWNYGDRWENNQLQVWVERGGKNVEAVQLKVDPKEGGETGPHDSYELKGNLKDRVVIQGTVTEYDRLGNDVADGKKEFTLSELLKTQEIDMKETGGDTTNRLVIRPKNPPAPPTLPPWRALKK